MWYSNSESVAALTQVIFLKVLVRQYFFCNSRMCIFVQTQQSGAALSKIRKQFSAGILAAASEPALFHPENAPHAGFNIPFEGAGAIQIITGAGGAVL